jgi:AhpD family alkylhydroperoxidase
MKLKNPNEKNLEALTEKDPDKAVQLILNKIKETYGLVPLVLEVLSRRPDIFIPFSQMFDNLFLKPKYLSQKSVELVSLGAATALGSESCIAVHFMQARKAGASIDEIFEAVLIGTIMAMTKSQAIAFRKFHELKDK